MKCPCLTVKRNFSLLTLTPHSDEDRQAFWEFRCKDIAQMFTIWLAISSFSFATRIIEFISNQERREVVPNTLHVIKYLLVVLVWCLRKKKHSVYLIIIVSGIVQLYNGDRSYREMQKETEYIAIERELEIYLKRLWLYWAIICLTLTPSIQMMIIGHALPYAIISIALVTGFAKGDEAFLPELPLYVIVTLIAVYTFQARELRRFYEQKASN